MTTTEPRCIGDLPRVVNASLGFVLPEFDFACGFHTLGHFTRRAWSLAVVSSHLQREQHAANRVIRRTNGPAGRTASTKLVATKSP